MASYAYSQHVSLACTMLQYFHPHTEVRVPSHHPIKKKHKTMPAVVFIRLGFGCVDSGGAPGA